MTRLREYLRAHGPVLVSVGFSVAWTALALRAPTTTYHLVPGLVAASWPVTARVLRGPHRLPAAIRAALGGVVVAVVTTAELAGLDSLDGPALIGGSGAGESVLVALAGGAWGARVAARVEPGFVLKLLGVPDQRSEAGGKPT
ncbi:MAG: hypothetical protein ACSLFO_13505 [Acidimicrobiales bacterium]